MMAWAPASKPGDTDPLISDAKKHLRRFSYGTLLQGDDSDEYTQVFGAALRQWQNNVHSLVITNRRQPPDTAVDGVFGWSSKKQMGLLPDTPKPPPLMPQRAIYSFTGTWGAWNNGFGWDVGERCNRGLYQHQPLGYHTGAFLTPDPRHSYVDMLNDGEAEFWRFGATDRRPKVLTGYSGGADCVSQVLRHWPADRRHEIIGVMQFGDPSRPPGKTLLGNDPGGHGISEDYPPDWVLDRYYSFTLEGDMYPNAVGLLPIFYDILVRIEVSGDFVMYLFQLLADRLGNLTPIGQLVLGLGGASGIPGFGVLSALLPFITGGAQPGKANLVAMMTNIPAIIMTIMAALRFLTTHAHERYGDLPVFGGMTAVDRAVQIVNSL